MNDILHIAEDLAEDIAKSELYQNYLYYKQQMLHKPELWEKIKQAKQMQIELGLKRKNQEFIALEEEAGLSDLFSEIMLDETAAGFWKYRNEMMQLESGIFRMITEKAPLDVAFLQEHEAN